MTLFEYYDVTPNNANAIYGSVRYAQTFTVGESAHTISSVQLLMYKVGTVGTVTVEIKTVDGTGKPTGPALTSNTFDGSTLATSYPGAWKEITLTSHILSVSTMYAIEVSMSDGSTNNWVVWSNELIGNYSAGKGWYSSNGGSTWTDYNQDFMFKVYGAISVAYTVAISETLGLSDDLSRKASFKQALTEKLGLTDALTKKASFYQAISDSLGLTDSVLAEKIAKVSDLFRRLVKRIESYG
jgi:hypothetical protein